MRMALAVKDRSRSLLRAYHAAMHEYIKKPREEGLELAYELGRRALDQGAAMVDVAGIYHQALTAVLRGTKPSFECVRKVGVAGSFFVESLSPFEMTYRGHHEAQAAMRQLNEGMEAEAKRIAHALHDEAGQLLTSVHFALERLTDVLPLSSQPLIEDVRFRLAEVEGQLRRLSHELRPPMLDLLGLVPALQFLAQGVTQRSGIEVVVQGSTPGRLSPLVEITLYRSVQEALTNVTKHAKASIVTVQVQRQECEKNAMIVCSVKDDGVGFDAQARSGEELRHGLGLLGIRERIKAVAGSVELRSAPGLGTELCIQVPLRD
jgi:signal transduction histidine kinase